jgi:Flp pilus assembly pilin Flp
MIEYSLLMALVLAVSVVGIRLIGNWVSDVLSVFVSP